MVIINISITSNNIIRKFLGGKLLWYILQILTKLNMKE